MTRLSPALEAPKPLPRVPFRKRPVVIMLGAGSLGFVCGAMFWHLVGFWSFVSDVVLRGSGDETRQAQDTLRAQPPAHLRPTGTISPVRPVATGRPGKPPSTCATGAADADTCQPDTGSVTSKAVIKRDDIEPAARVFAPSPVLPQVTPGPKTSAPASWSTTIQPLPRTN
jgi:hypothetical protein